MFISEAAQKTGGVPLESFQKSFAEHMRIKTEITKIPKAAKNEKTRENKLKMLKRNGKENQLVVNSCSKTNVIAQEVVDGAKKEVGIDPHLVGSASVENPALCKGWLLYIKCLSICYSRDKYEMS